jgi:hypothetical protein
MDLVFEILAAVSYKPKARSKLSAGRNNLSADTVMAGYSAAFSAVDW